MNSDLAYAILGPCEDLRVRYSSTSSTARSPANARGRTAPPARLPTRARLACAP